MDILIFLAFTVILGLVGLIFGRINEKKHYRSIVEREKRYQHILLFNEKLPPVHLSGQPFYLVDGSTVMSSDYFKQIIANLKLIFGGRISSYESMLDRGRREAILRMKAEAAKKGATMIFNVCLHTSPLNDQNSGQYKSNCIEILAYGTAWVAPKA
ncbi:MAG: YbjQ family protein [Saezia sp.]